MTPLRWQPSSDGFAATHCSHYKIKPEYWGRCEAQSYRLVYFPDVKTLKGAVRLGSCDTQREAKERADKHAHSQATTGQRQYKVAVDDMDADIVRDVGAAVKATEYALNAGAALVTVKLFQ